MGKRKKSSRKPMGPKKVEALPTQFTCLFCNHEKSVSVRLDKKAGIGSLECKVCGQKFQCGINYLSAAVDVYGEWVDAADAVAKEQGANQGGRLDGGMRDFDERFDDRPARRANDEDDLRYSGDRIVADDEEVR